MYQVTPRELQSFSTSVVPGGMISAARKTKILPVPLRLDPEAWLQLTVGWLLLLPHETQTHTGPRRSLTVSLLDING